MGFKPAGRLTGVCRAGVCRALRARYGWVQVVLRLRSGLLCFDVKQRLESGRGGSTSSKVAHPWAGLAVFLGVSGCLVFSAVAMVVGRPQVVSAEVRSRPDREQALLVDPDAVCAQCHAAIVASYKRTAMGAGSGAAMAGLLPGEFTHGSSGVRYRVFARDGRAWMSFARPSTSAAAGLEGERELLYYVGSGKRGRTYLYEAAGEWFELPINWYGRRGRWDMAPAFDDATSMPALPVEPNCLHCHATQVKAPLAEARNRFAGRPFDQGGVGCSACHGDGTAHVAAQGHGPIANPGKMSVAARDSACVQCHLEGDAVVYRPGKSLAQFQAGDLLSDFAVYFVRASQAGGGQRASSQYEALLKSACKRGAGDALTCTTCHDPHSEPSAPERVAFYRGKCLGCHTSPAIALGHHPEQPDCAVCHMPSRKTADISHEQVTDHDVERVPGRESAGGKGWVAGEALVPVGGVSAGDREMGLAYAQRAQKGDTKAGERALGLLLRAEAAGANDEQVHVNLGFLEQVAGDSGAARREYAAALRANPYGASALVNRAVLDAGAGNVAEAVRLLDRLVQADPSQTLAGVDLLELECRAGEVERASALVERLRVVDPDSTKLRDFVRRGGCRSLAASR